jgi:rRNA-processing protein FCF1
MKLIITDTNIFFDLIGIEALPEFFSLEYEICTTDFVIKEVLQSNQKEQVEAFIRAQKLTIFRLTAEEIDEIRIFPTIRQFKGITDKTVLWKSYQLKCTLLTGDGKLRKEAEDLKIEVHGSIWVVNLLVKNGIITKIKGVDLLVKLRGINTSLPNDEIEKLIRRFK